MNTKNAAIVRGKYLEKLVDFCVSQGEDVGVDSSGSFNFPVVEGDEEGWVQIVVKIPKWTEDDDGYSKREDYTQRIVEKQEKKQAKEAEKAEAAAKRKAAKEAKAREKAEKEKEVEG